MKMSVPVDEVFKKQLTTVYKSQLGLQEAFIASDANKVKKEVPDVIAMLNQVDMSLVKGDMHIHWMNDLKTLVDALEKIQNHDDIGDQRLVFSDFNDALYSTLKMFGTSGEIIYYQYCPMANDNNGSYLLSTTEEIRNPYFGDAMLKCGETKEIIK
jgi:Cu(I)/Ag(I) efflux system membrane fusion protein